MGRVSGLFALAEYSGCRAMSRFPLGVAVGSWRTSCDAKVRKRKDSVSRPYDAEPFHSGREVPAFVRAVGRPWRGRPRSGLRGQPDRLTRRWARPVLVIARIGYCKKLPKALEFAKTAKPDAFFSPVTGGAPGGRTWKTRRAVRCRNSGAYMSMPRLVSWKR